MSKEGKKTGALATTHLLLCVGLACFGVQYYVKHTPVRQVWQAVAVANSGAGPKGLASFGARMEAVTPVIWPDLLLGAASLLVFSLGTGIYVKRLETYLSIRTSGQVAEVRAIGIQTQALESNIGRKGGMK